MSENQEQRIKRLERAVRGLTIAFILSIGFSIFAFYQITAITSKIPSYHELKEDVQSIKKLYDNSVEAMPKVGKKIGDGYDYTKEKVSDGYDYTKEKVADGYNYTKKKTGEVIEYFSGDDEEKKKEESGKKSKSK